MTNLESHRKTWKGKTDEWLFERLANELTDKVDVIHKLLEEIEQLKLTSVSQQRELLLDYIMKSSSKHVHIDDATHWVNQYFRKKSNNCG